MKKILTFLIAVTIPEVVGILSATFTIDAIQTWYKSLNKPIFSPPNWVFAPVWTTLYFLMGLAAYLIFIKGWKNKKVKHALGYFVMQLILNFFWSYLFFARQSPLLGLLDILLLWIAILITIMQFQKLSKPAAILMIPYLLWVTFAVLLNFSILILNL